MHKHQNVVRTMSSTRQKLIALASMIVAIPSATSILMVSAHKIDLKAAKSAGFKTAYIARAGELGPDTKVDRKPEPFVDVYADSLTDLARKLDVDTVRPAN